MTSSPHTQSKIIAVASGKGGVGKTWVSTTLCHLLYSSGKNILLFDGDLGLANVDIQLGLMPDADLGQVLSGAIPLSSAITRYETGRNGVNFDIISGQSGSGALSSLSKNALGSLNEGLSTLSRDYDYTVIDLGAGVENSVLTLCEITDQVIVVATADPTSLTDAYAFIKMSRMRNPKLKLDILVNMVEDRHEGQKTYNTLKKACENFLKFTPSYLGSVVRDKYVVDAIRHQKPLLKRHPTSKAGENMEEISKKV